MNPLPLLLGASVLGIGAGIVWALHKKTSPTSPESSPLNLRTTQRLSTGQLYALNLYAVPGLDSASVRDLLTRGPFGAIQDKPPALVKAGVTGTGYTFSDTQDQWIAWVRALESVDLPRLFGYGGSDVRGVIQTALVDVTQAAPVVLLSDPAPLLPGRSYRARANATGLVSYVASKNAIANKMTDLGFSNPKVYASPTELPSDWPTSFRAAFPSGDTYWAEGQYQGTAHSESKPDFVQVWENVA